MSWTRACVDKNDYNKQHFPQVNDLLTFKKTVNTLIVITKIVYYPSWYVHYVTIQRNGVNNTFGIQFRYNNKRNGDLLLCTEVIDV